ncbi:MAG: leucine-rich repeat domain-containing protein [Candidatus Hodarchaeota archaeon]
MSNIEKSEEWELLEARHNVETGLSFFHTVLEGGYKRLPKAETYRKTIIDFFRRMSKLERETEAYMRKSEVYKGTMMYHGTPLRSIDAFVLFKFEEFMFGRKIELVPIERLEHSRNRVVFSIEGKNVTGLNITDYDDYYLGSIPASIGWLSKLIYLALEGPFFTVPASIERLENLRMLNISSPFFEEAPKRVFQLKNLTHLGLPRSNLSTLPENIDSLRNLKCIDIAHNQITTLPSSLSNLPHLERLDLRGNKDLNVPTELVSDLEKKGCTLIM